MVIADCQRDLQKFHVSIYAMSLAGEGRELARETVGSFDDIAELQQDWKVRDQHVFLDCGYNMTAVLRECVKHGHVAKVRIGKQVRKVWLCWTGLKGSGTEMFRHRNPRHPELVEWKVFSEMKYYDVNLGTKRRGPRAPWLEWSNLHCKDMLRARRDGDPGVPPLKFLPDTLPQSDVWSHWQQLRSEHRIEKYDGGKKRAVWVLTREGRPNHEWDKASMLMAFMCVVGIIGVDLPQASGPAPIVRAE